MIDPELHRELAETLLKIPVAQDYMGRSVSLTGIPNQHSLNRSSTSAQTDMDLLINQLAEIYLELGEWTLLIFIKNIQNKVRGTNIDANLRDLQKKLIQSSRNAEKPADTGDTGNQVSPHSPSIVSAHFPTTPQQVTRKERAMSGFEQGYALIIGINDCPDIGKLSESVLKDALGIHTALKDFGGYAKNHLKTLINEQASDSAIRQGLAWLAESAGPNATAVVYFSGHGGRIEIDSQVKHYLIPHNCDLSNLDGTAISSSDLTELLHTIKAQRLLCLFDSCYSAGIGEIKGPGEQKAPAYGPEKDYYRQLAFNQLEQGSGRVIIASSRSDEVSRILPDMNNSLFTRYLLEALEGKADTGGDGLIRVSDVFKYVSKMVPQQSPQCPIIITAGTEDFPIALYLGGQKVSSNFSRSANMAQSMMQKENVGNINQAALREAMVPIFSLEDLDALCADIEQALRDDGINLQVNLEMVGGSGKPGKILNLIAYLYRRGHLSYLVAAVQKVRPDIVF